MRLCVNNVRRALYGLCCHLDVILAIAYLQVLGI